MRRGPAAGVGERAVLAGAVVAYRGGADELGADGDFDRLADDLHLRAAELGPDQIAGSREAGGSQPADYVDDFDRGPRCSLVDACRAASSGSGHRLFLRAPGRFRLGAAVVLGAGLIGGALAWLLPWMVDLGTSETWWPGRPAGATILVYRLMLSRVATNPLYDNVYSESNDVGRAWLQLLERALEGR
jgi:hypothetical protein